MLYIYQSTLVYGDILPSSLYFLKRGICALAMFDLAQKTRDSYPIAKIAERQKIRKILELIPGLNEAVR
jgi:hypothetical protein